MSSPPGISHVFFEVGGALIDRAQFGGWYAENLGRILAARFGLTPAAWSAAYQRVLLDWDSYYADLNLSGDDGLADLWEGQFRTTRALFRLTGSPEPDKTTLTALARELPALAARGHSAFYPDVGAGLRQLADAGLTLGVVSYATAAQLEAQLEPVRDCFTGAIWGADNAERFDKDAQRYRSAAARAGAAPENCLVVDIQVEALAQAAQAGLQTARLWRGAAPADDALSDLHALARRLGLAERC